MTGRSRVALVFAAAALAALAGIVVVNLARPSQAPSTAAQVEQIASELRCPTCQALSVADSTSTAAREIRQQIAALLDDGATPEEVKRHFVDRYGEWILLAPSSPFPWLVPFVLLVLGGLALATWLARSRPRPAEHVPVVPAPLSERVREEVEAFDA